MDYKELIRRLRASNRDAIVSSDEAATAIETLLAERDAAVEQIRGECYHCANVRKCYSGGEMMRDCARNNRRNWQWRGPQKDGGGT